MYSIVQVCALDSSWSVPDAGPLVRSVTPRHGCSGRERSQSGPASPIRGNGRSSQLAGIQPVHLTPLARVDDDVPVAAIEVAEHWSVASWTIDDAVIGILAARRKRRTWPFFKHSHGIDDGREAVHVDQHPETARAAEHRKTLESTGRERSVTVRAQARRLAPQNDTFGDPRQFLLIAAMVAQQDATVAVYPQGGSATGAVCHDRIIGETCSTGYPVAPSIPGSKGAPSQTLPVRREPHRSTPTCSRGRRSAWRRRTRADAGDQVVPDGWQPIEERWPRDRAPAG